VELLGPIAGGCVNEMRGGGKCGAGALGGLRAQWGNDLVNQASSAGADYLSGASSIQAAWPSDNSTDNSHNSDDGGDGLGTNSSENRTVLAVAPGTVEKVGWQDPNNHDKGFGFRIRIKTDAGETWIYGHMEPPTMVSEGQQIQRDQIIGNYAAPTNGNSSGPHLHIELRDKYNKPVWGRNEAPDEWDYIKYPSPISGGRITSKPASRRSITTVNGSQSRPHGGFDWR
jgi:murein DD-endopeptidase MepM/ murein hydrolase activator NlpD